MDLGVSMDPESYIKWGSHWRNLANTTEQSVWGGDAALCQITFTTCYRMAYTYGRDQTTETAKLNSAVADEPSNVLRHGQRVVNNDGARTKLTTHVVVDATLCKCRGKAEKSTGQV